MLSCKEIKDDLKIYPISSEMAGYLFDTGSYWIYTNPITLKNDTNRVFSSKRAWFNAGGPGGRFQFLTWKMSMKNMANNDSISFEIAQNTIWQSFNEKAILIINNHESPDSSIIYRHFREMEKWDRISLNGKQYRNLRKVRIEEFADSATSNYEQYYFADSVGIVEWEKYENGARVNHKKLLDYRVRLGSIWHKP